MHFQQTDATLFEKSKKTAIFFEKLAKSGVKREWKKGWGAVLAFVTVALCVVKLKCALGPFLDFFAIYCSCASIFMNVEKLMNSPVICYD